MGHGWESFVPSTGWVGHRKSFNYTTQMTFIYGKAHQKDHYLHSETLSKKRTPWHFLGKPLSRRSGLTGSTASTPGCFSSQSHSLTSNSIPPGDPRDFRSGLYKHPRQSSKPTPKLLLAGSLWWKIFENIYILKPLFSNWGSVHRHCNTLISVSKACLSCCQANTEGSWLLPFYTLSSIEELCLGWGLVNIFCLHVPMQEIQISTS